MGASIFSEINNAVLDLQRSQLQTYPRPLKKLALLLKSPELVEKNAKLTEGLDLEKFLNQSEATEKGSVGSAMLAWPDDSTKALGLTILLIERFGENPDYIIDFSFRFFFSGRKIISNIHSCVSQLIIPFVRDYKAYIERSEVSLPVTPINPSKKVFIVHGHDDLAKESVARFIAQLGLLPVILHEQASSSKTIIEKIETYSDVGFAVVLYTPCDVGMVKGGEQQSRARQNVVFEHGYFIGKLGRERVTALVKGQVEKPNDISGVVYIDLDDRGAWKMDLAKELKQVGYQLNTESLI